MTSTEKASQIRFAGAISREAIANAIDHTKLTFKPDENQEEAIRKLCKEAKENHFFAVCVRPQHVQLAKGELAGSAVKVATVIGFPDSKVDKARELKSTTVGCVTTGAKLAEVRDALAAGVDELDLVLNVREFRREAPAWAQPNTLRELKEIVKAAQGRPVKVIIETDLLSDSEIVKATKLCAEADVAMVKTCTGMVKEGRGATVPVVELIKRTLEECGKPNIQIKASGGIKTAEQAAQLLQAGASRLGTSSGVEILQGTASQHDY